MIPLELLHGLGSQKCLSFSAFLEEEVRFPRDKSDDHSIMLIRTRVLLMSQFSMKDYTKVGNLDESQISIVNKKLNPTLRKHRTRTASIRLFCPNQCSPICSRYSRVDSQTLAAGGF